jgi:hypothetical protein
MAAYDADRISERRSDRTLSRPSAEVAVSDDPSIAFSRAALHIGPSVPRRSPVTRHPSPATRYPSPATPHRPLAVGHPRPVSPSRTLTPHRSSWFDFSRSAPVAHPSVDVVPGPASRSRRVTLDRPGGSGTRSSCWIAVTPWAFYSPMTVTPIERVPAVVGTIPLSSRDGIGGERYQTVSSASRTFPASTFSISSSE